MFEWLFHDGYMARGACVLWEPAVLIARIFGDAQFFTAYVAIPTFLFVRRKHVRDSGVFGTKTMLWSFILFIALCGATHLSDILLTWYPVYRLDALVRLLGGSVSWFTVGYMLYLYRVYFPRKELDDELGKYSGRIDAVRQSLKRTSDMTDDGDER